MTSRYKLISETKLAFLQRAGKLIGNGEKRYTTRSSHSRSQSRQSRSLIGLGYIIKIGTKKIGFNFSIGEVRKILDRLPSDGIIIEQYTTDFCKNCRRSASNFVVDSISNHQVCTGCGVCSPINTSNYGSNHLDDDGNADNNAYCFAPPDTELGETCQQDLVRRVPSHKRNYWRIDNKIKGIINMFWAFNGLQSILCSARAKLLQFYKNTHENFDGSDNQRKMPHGGAAFAAACIYAAVLEFEAVGHHGPTVATLSVIHHYALTEVDKKYDGKVCITRELTVLHILRLTNRLVAAGLCKATVPDFNAQSLLYTPETSKAEHLRMALFDNCGCPQTIILPKNVSLGFGIKDTEKGALVIASVVSGGVAFQRGLRRGDLILTLEGESIPATETKASFGLKFKAAQKKKKDVFRLEIMRPRHKKRKISSSTSTSSLTSTTKRSKTVK